MSRNLRAQAQAFASRLAPIKVLAFDVDGILTDGRLWYEGPPVGWNRAFNTRDGHMMRELMGLGYKVGVMTGGESVSIRERFGSGNKGPGGGFYLCR